jgi:hypothetical protein
MNKAVYSKKQATENKKKRLTSKSTNPLNNQPDINNHITSARTRKLSHAMIYGCHFNVDAVVIAGGNCDREVLLFKDKYPIVYTCNPWDTPHDNRTNLVSDNVMTKLSRPNHKSILFYCPNSIYYISKTLTEIVKPGDIIVCQDHLYSPHSAAGSLYT